MCMGMDSSLGHGYVHGGGLIPWDMSLDSSPETWVWAHPLWHVVCV